MSEQKLFDRLAGNYHKEDLALMASVGLITWITTYGSRSMYSVNETLIYESVEYELYDMLVM